MFGRLRIAAGIGVGAAMILGPGIVAVVETRTWFTG